MWKFFIFSFQIFILMSLLPQQIFFYFHIKRQFLICHFWWCQLETLNYNTPRPFEHWSSLKALLYIHISYCFRKSNKGYITTTKTGNCLITFIYTYCVHVLFKKLPPYSDLTFPLHVRACARFRLNWIWSKYHQTQLVYGWFFWTFKRL